MCRKLRKVITSKDEEERTKKIRGSKCNIEYERVRIDRRTEYLKTKRKKRDMRLTARFRCGNELERTCRI